MAYKVVTELGLLAQIDEVTEYLSVSLGSPESANSLLEQLESVKNLLKTLPDSFSPVNDEGLCRRGYRVAHVGNYLLLFRVERDETSDGEPSGTVYVTHFFHGSQNYFGLV